MADDKEETPIVGAADSSIPAEGYVVPKKRSAKCIAIAVLWVILLLFTLGALIAIVVLVGFKPIVVKTTCGPVEGSVNDGIYSYKGIPFAQPPKASLRWQPPVPIEKKCWSGTLQANTFKSECPQNAPGYKEVTGDEDCLYLNVYTPTPPNRNTSLPVMLYIHGGYLQFCNGSMRGYSPDERVAKSTNMVHVSIQYRLSALGFLVLDILNGTGNYGLLDQIQALKWVKDNIANFGGNPNDVTIYGQSSGGTSVWALMLSPLAKGLFHKAWSLSGSPILNKTLEDAKIQNEFFKNQTECHDTKCLYDLPAKKVIEAVSNYWNFSDSNDLPTKGLFEAALLVVDGHVLPDSPFNMWDLKKGNYSDVPFIVGTTAQETDLSPAPGMALKRWKKSDLHSYVSNRLDPFGNNITNISLAFYDHPSNDSEYVFTTMSTDIRLTCGNHILAEKGAKALSSNVYEYIVNYIPSRAFYAYGGKFESKYSFHTLDLIGFYDVFDILMPKDSGPNEKDKEFSRTVRENMLHFVRYGTPSDPRWKNALDNTALISSQIDVTPKYHQEQCKFWVDNGFFSYSWIN